MANDFIYIYLAIWFILTLGGLIAQYKMNKDKTSNDYKRID